MRSRWASIILPIIAATAGCGGGDSAPVVPPSWGTAVLLEASDDHAGNAQVAVDAAGNAIVVWQQRTGTYRSVWANRYDAASGWGTAVLIDTAEEGDSFRPRVAVDGDGNAIAAWERNDLTRSNIWAARYDAVDGWAAAGKIETDDAGTARKVRLAFDGAGDALAVWEQSDGVRFNIWAARYDAVDGWEGPGLIEADDSGHAEEASVAFDGEGNAFAVWDQFDGTEYSVYAARFDAVDGWEAPTPLETADRPAFSATVSFDGAGNAFAAWRQEDDGYIFRPMVARYTPAGGWAAPENVGESVGTDNIASSAIAVAPTGSALVLWSEGGSNDLWARRFSPGGGWAQRQRVDAGDYVDGSPVLAVDAAGNALAVWQEFAPDDAKTGIWANRFNPTRGWGTAALIEAVATTAANPHLAIDPFGHGIAVWEQLGTGYDIWANRFE